MSGALVSSSGITLMSSYGYLGGRLCLHLMESVGASQILNLVSLTIMEGGTYRHTGKMGGGGSKFSVGVIFMSTYPLFYPLWAPIILHIGVY